MRNLVVNSDEITCRNIGRLGLEQVISGHVNQWCSHQIRFQR